MISINLLTVFSGFFAVICANIFIQVVFNQATLLDKGSFLFQIKEKNIQKIKESFSNEVTNMRKAV
ncbi:hypothetical protein SPBRAN_794 [uncultured Candidatus Thioglobus sp.]|nr:hypothetical protein SPBRAN_794 [uncultured Candidatus Thioglobus sp.]